MQMMKKTKTSKHLIVSTLAALMLATSCIVLDSKYNLRAAQYNLPVRNLPAEFDDFRIVQISDLHGASFGRDNERLIELVVQQKPDMIALTGDLAQSDKDYAAVEALLRGIYDLAPIYYVNGNHEWHSGYVDKMQALMKLYGVHCLSNEYELFERSGAHIVIAGVEDPNGRADMIKPDAFAEKIREEYPEEYLVLLGHRNYWVDRYPVLPVNLILSGHAHGGIVRLPFIGGLFSSKHTLGATFEKGVYSSGYYQMVVSTGLGNSIPIPRFLNRPEIVTIVLESAQKN